jgi:hypothetical protein
MAIVERGDDGGLYVPPDLLRQFQPRAAFEIESDADSIVLRAIDQGRAFWQRSSTEERIKAIHEWAEADRPSAPDLTLEMMSRDSIYD